MPSDRNTSSENAANYLAVPLAWLVPGAGHIALGYRGRGLIFALTIHLLFAAGLFLGGIRALNPPDQAIWTYTQYLAGWPMLVGSRVQAAMAPAIDKLLAPSGRSVYENEYEDKFHSSRTTDLIDPAKADQIREFNRDFVARHPNAVYHPKIQDIAAVYCGIAGMLNLLVVFDVLLRVTGSSRIPAGKPKAASPETKGDMA